ncbi:MAG: metallophosphoesterase [Ignavibacteriaceae bacterium]|nr:metallophosphoesterase [Ignavibacteriaceae bacterium]
MVAVIGDIHGCFFTLQEIVEKIKNKYADIPIYCVGDLVDRGNFSYEVVEFVKKEKIKFTPGNHDLMFYYFVKKPRTEMADSWLYNGYEQTMASYEEHFEELREHIVFLSSAPLFFNLSDCFISHAGISVHYKKQLGSNPLNDIEKLEEIITADVTNTHSIIWTREELMNIGKLQIVGHTRQSEIKFVEENNALYIDTSIYTGNKLSAVIVENNKVIDEIAVPTDKKDIA